MSRRIVFVIIVLTALSLFGVSRVIAQAGRPVAPQAALGSGFTYQGQLKDGGGNPITKTCDFQFTLWDALASGNQVGGISPVASVSVTNGSFNAMVNGGGEFGDAAFSGDARWLETSVKCSGDAGYTALAPRQALTAAPYALTLRPGAVIQGAGGSNGVGLEVENTTATGNTYSVAGMSDSTNGTGVLGNATAASGSTYGVVGTSSSTGGLGVWGYASATSGYTTGVAGTSSSPSGTGVYGYNNAASGQNTGVWGGSTSTSGIGVFGYASAVNGSTYGVSGKSDSDSGIGVYGYSSATSGGTFGVWGMSDSINGIGVLGRAQATSGTNYGVAGQSYSNSGYGVSGYASASSGTTYGVSGQVHSTSGFGVYGYADATSGINYGVYGRSDSAAGYGVFSQGNLGYTGTITHVVATADYGWRSLYSMESSQVWDEDVSSAQLVQGQAVVPIDPVFTQTVNLTEPYDVFLTPTTADCALRVAVKTLTNFTVNAIGGQQCNGAFDYRIIAKRLGYEQTRLAPAQDPTTIQQAAPAAQPAGSHQH